jgi:hypothetical protein
VEVVARLSILAAAGVTFIAVGLAVPLLLGPDRQVNVTTNVTLVATDDYGKTVLGTWEFKPAQGLTAMEMLRNVTSVETRYGGLYLYAMFGRNSDISKRIDWLYYVNGVYMGTGLATYRPKQGEVIHLDYHRWGGYAASPGFLSGYPNKLIYGVDGQVGNTTIVSPEALAGVAKRLAKYLEGWLGYRPEVMDPASVAEDDLGENLIILATPSESSFYQETQGWRSNVLWPSTFEDGSIWLHGLDKEQRTPLVEGCTVQAMDFKGRDKWALMLIGTSPKWVEKGLEELKKGGSTSRVPGFAVSPSGLTSLPVE